LAGTLDRAIRLFRSASYKQRWPEVGNVNPVRDANTIAGLDAQLDAELAWGQTLKRLVLFTPAERHGPESQIAHSDVSGHMMGKPVYPPYLLIESWITFLKEKKLVPTVAEAKKDRVHLLDEAKEELSDYFVYDCFGYELTFGGRPFVLSSGNWYEVVADFVAQINKYIAGIKGPSVALTRGIKAIKSKGSRNTTRGAVALQVFCISTPRMFYSAAAMQSSSSAIFCT
jgi:uncharacterized protein (TIGR04141 family)